MEPNSESPETSFSAFISYSRDANLALAGDLEIALEGLKKQWWWQRRGPLRIFRDKSVLLPSSDLERSLATSLGASAYLVLLASPESAASRWVNEEVAWWLKERSTETLIIVLTNGELIWNEQNDGFDVEQSTALPPSLATAYKAVPVWVDLRGAKEAEGRAVFDEGVAEVGAKLLGCAKDDLIGEQRRIHLRNIRLAIAAGCIGVFLLVALVLSGFFGLGQWETSEAEAARKRAAQKAAQSRDSFVATPRAALRLAIEALDVSTAAGLPPEAAAESALRNAVRLSGGHSLATLDQPINSVTLDRDARWLVALTAGRSVHIFDLASSLPGQPVVTNLDGKRVDALTMSKTGKWIAADCDGTLELWQREGNKAWHLSRTITERHGGSLAFSEDDRYLAFGTFHGGVQLVDLASDGAPAHLQMPEEARRIAGLAFAGSSLIAGIVINDRPLPAPSGGGQLLRWDLSQAQGLPESWNAIGPCLLAVSPDGDFAATTSTSPWEDGWIVSLGDKPNPFGLERVGGGVPLNDAAFDMSGGRLRLAVSSRNDGALHLYGPDHEPTRFSGGGEMAFTPNGKWLIWTAGDNALRIVNPGWIRRAPLLKRAHDAPINSLSLSANGELAATADEAGHIHLWPVAAFNQWPLIIPGPSSNQMRRVKFDHVLIRPWSFGLRDHFTFADDGKSLLTINPGEGYSVFEWSLTRPERGILSARRSIGAEQNGQTFVYDMDGRAQRFVGEEEASLGEGFTVWEGRQPIFRTGRLPANRGGATRRLLLSPNGAWLVHRHDDDPTVRLWSLEAGVSEEPMTLQFPATGTVAFDPGSRWLVLRHDNDVSLKDLSKRPPSTLEIDWGPLGPQLSDVAFAAHSGLLAGVGSNGRVGVIDLASPEGSWIIFDISEADKGPRDPSVALSADGRWLGVVSGSDSALLWDLEQAPSSKCIPLPDHTGGATTMEFHPSVPKVASASAAGELRIWRLPEDGTVTEPTILPYENDRVITRIKFSRDGRWLAAVDLAGFAHFWNVSNKDLVARAQRILGE